MIAKCICEDGRIIVCPFGYFPGSIIPNEVCDFWEGHDPDDPVGGDPGDQDLSLPAIHITDCGQTSIKFCDFQGQNCIIAVKSTSAQPQNLIFHGNKILLFGYNMLDSVYFNSIFYTYNVKGSLTDNIFIGLLTETPGGGIIYATRFAGTFKPEPLFNILTFPQVGAQNYSQTPAYWFWGCDPRGANLWFGRHFANIYEVE